MVLNAPIVGAAVLPTAGGYWEGAADGGIFAFGAAGYYGSTGSLHLNKPIVGMSPPRTAGLLGGGQRRRGVRLRRRRLLTAPTVESPQRPHHRRGLHPGRRGLLDVASDGGVFTFGDARFFGSAVGMSPDSPIVGMASTPDGQGYWEAASNGAVFAFGDARYAGGAPAGRPIVGVAAGGPGYRLATADGGVLDFGGAEFHGSAAGIPLDKPVIGHVVDQVGLRDRGLRRRHLHLRGGGITSARWVAARSGACPRNRRGRSSTGSPAFSGPPGPG